MWTIWFADGMGRQMINTRKELYDLGERFGFKADDVIAFDEIEMTDEYGDIIGGVFSNFTEGK